MKKVDAIISRIITELDDKQAAHQETYKQYHGSEDEGAKRVHEMMVALCRRIRKELSKAGV
jgi:hypothetical protein